jgi:DNA-binding NarL/FixJ family response regulator
MVEIVRVLVINDHRIFGEAIEMVLKAERGIETIGVVGNGEEATVRSCQERPDVALIDFDRPAIDGMAVTRRIKAGSPKTQVVMMTAFPQPAILAGAIESGVSDVVLTTKGAPELLEAVRRVGAQGRVLPRAASLS